MPKQLVEAHKIPGKERWRVCVPMALRTVDSHTRRFFGTEKEATKFAAQLNASRNSLTGQFLALSPTTQSRLLLCLDKLKGDIGALEAATEQAIARRSTLTKILPAAIFECITAKQKADRRSKYVVNLNLTLDQFAAGRETRAVSDITGPEIDRWLTANGWAAETRRSYLSRLRMFFRWCKKRGYVAFDPCSALENPSDEGKAPGILTVDECRRLLEACRKVDPGMIPYFAIGLFAGVRPDEILRLSWDHIRDGWIEIPAWKAKTRQRRLVEIWSPLDQWLKLKGELPPGKNFAKRWTAVRAATEVKDDGGKVILKRINWSHDCMRHSFCSYAYPVHGAKETSLMAGHSEDVLFRKYRRLVHKTDSEAFWKLSPS